MVTNGQALDDELGCSDIRYMTCILLLDAPESVYTRWEGSLFTPVEFSMRQSTWRIILQVEASGGRTMTTETLTAPDFQPPCTFGHGELHVATPCDQTATWVAVRGCCAAVCMWCDTHHAYCTGPPITTGQWACSDCTALIPRGEKFPFVRVERIR